MNKPLIIWCLNYTMDVVCMKHAIPFKQEEDCPICVNEALKILHDAMFEYTKRKEWEKLHKKVLGE